MSQVNYESGKRYPGEEYFENLKNVAGIDIAYLAWGVHSDYISNLNFRITALLDSVALELGLQPDAFESAWLEALSESGDENAESDTPAPSESVYERAARYAKETLSRSPVLLCEAPLLEVLKGVEEVISRRGVQLPAEKKARVILLLYRQRQAASQLHQSTIEDAIALAVG